jgi:DNA-directed RNA polymerase subunit RPC12/RpoP
VKYLCEKCKKEIDVPEDKAKWTYVVECECGGKAYCGKPIRRIMTKFK